MKFSRLFGLTVVASLVSVLPAQAEEHHPYNWSGFYIGAEGGAASGSSDWNFISFTNGDGAPPLALDLPHEGWRGGSMRTRYFGQLEGVTPEAKALAREAAAAAGVSVHEWLDRLVKEGAGRASRAGDDRS